jgi:hypothetical protein
MQSGEQPGPLSDRGEQPFRGLASADNGVRPDDDVAESDRLAKGQPGEPEQKRDRESGRFASHDPLAPVDTEFQVAYTPASGKKDAGVLIPTNMRAPLEQAMHALEDEVGDVDEFVREQLGYPDKEEMYDALMGQAKHDM